MDKIIHIVSHILQNSPNGQKRLDLAKLIYYCDGVYFQKHAKIISQQKFMHMEDCPLPLDLDRTILYMKNNGYIDVKPEINNNNGLSGFLLYHVQDAGDFLDKEEKRVIKKVMEAFKRGVRDESKQYPNLYENYVITNLFSEITFSIDTLNTKIHFFKRKSLLQLSGKIFRILFS